ncbi:RHS repeat domain-containing protein [Terriglobus albidus]|uniref:RHS repeat domain-containing protein n=1 Tax=Terriglobus albidus TaxID=1592106 RepID=UPI0021DFBC50|nr:RHS repeat-associated core domain-containing protein [Terriglobus albidus]
MDNGATAQYTYDALNHRVRTQTSSATYKWTCDYAGRRITGWYQPGDLATQGRIYWGNQQIAYRAWNGRTYFDHQNPVGTERLRTDNIGAVAATYVSAPWGDEYSANEISPQGDGLDNLHFAGLDHDAESNTDHAMFRQYSPMQGRWLSPDPYDGSYDDSDPQSFNRYSYVRNSPLMAIDPSGQNPCAVATSFGAAFGGPAGATAGTAICIGDIAYSAIKEIMGVFSLFSHPSCHACDHPRPESTGVPNWDDAWNEHLGLPHAQLPNGDLGSIIGIDQNKCEFGICGNDFFGPRDHGHCTS